MFASAAAVFGQDVNKTSTAAGAAGNPLATLGRRFYGGMKNILLLSAEKMPEDQYSFKPTEAVRSYGQIIGHLADTHYGFCSIVLGEAGPTTKLELTKISKAELIAALKESFSYCDRAFNGMTDASAVQMVKFMGKDTPKYGVFTAYMAHSGLHYGNLVTYMRMKNIVPPTSEPGFLEPKKGNK